MKKATIDNQEYNVEVLELTDEELVANRGESALKHKHLMLHLYFPNNDFDWSPHFEHETRLDIQINDTKGSYILVGVDFHQGLTPSRLTFLRKDK